jgi:hypothetical protein
MISDMKTLVGTLGSMKTLVGTLGSIACLGLVTTGVAQAQVAAGNSTPSIAVGGEAMLLQSSGAPSGALFVYDAGPFHVDAIFGFASVDTGLLFGGDATAVGLGGRFLYVIHQAEFADFSVGGGLGFSHFSPDEGDSATNVYFEGLAQIRAFIVPNVALSASLGLAAGFLDDNVGGDGFGILGNTTGAAGIAYYFR